MTTMLPKLSVLTAVMLSISLTASAAKLQVTFMDPPGDQTLAATLPGQIDLLSMTLAFDDQTGAYNVTFLVNPSHPLFGSFELNANLVNGDLAFPPDRLRYEDMNNLFIDNFNEIVLDAPANRFSLYGVDSHLTHWRLGDRIATDTCTFSSNCFSAGYSLLSTIQGNTSSSLPFDTFSMDRNSISRIERQPAPVPVLPALLLLAPLIAAFGFYRHEFPGGA